jgi:hypothetical protein
MTNREKDRQHNDQKTEGCVVCPSLIYRFWLPLGIFWSLCCLSFFDLQILVTPLVSFGHCVCRLSFFEPQDTKGVTRICKSKKNRQHNDQKIPKR